jgi:hypothetical protein
MVPHGHAGQHQMGKDLERAMWRMYAPHKVKFAVSGCPRNCAESGIKDVGIIGVDSGWEMYIGGNGGIKTEVAHFFTKLKTAEEVMEYTGAFMQLYRLEGWYLERTVHYINRVGLDYVKRRILDDAEGRRALWSSCSLHWTASPTPGSKPTRRPWMRASSRLCLLVCQLLPETENSLSIFQQFTNLARHSQGTASKGRPVEAVVPLPRSERGKPQSGSGGA